MQHFNVLERPLRVQLDARRSRAEAARAALIYFF